MEKTPKITVFTPTYNRAYIIGNLYRSLQRQTFRNFEWLVIDDGSKDETEKLFAQWQQEENSFPIRYFRKENGGKCSAINYALDLAWGELFFTVDSDDYLTDDALEKLVEWESTLPKDQKFCGVSGNLGTSPTETPNTAFETPFVDGNLLDRYGKVDGERALAFYTEVHRNYKYPLFEGEKFMTEAVTWNRMARDGYRMRFYNDIIWVYEYKENGLTKAGNQLFINNPQGYGLWLREKAEFLHWPVWKIWKMRYSFTCDLAQRYCVDEIAQYIGASSFSIRVCRALHQLKNRLRK